MVRRLPPIFGDHVSLAFDPGLRNPARRRLALAAAKATEDEGDRKSRRGMRAGSAVIVPDPDPIIVRAVVLQDGDQVSADLNLVNSPGGALACSIKRPSGNGQFILATSGFEISVNFGGVTGDKAVFNSTSAGSTSILNFESIAATPDDIWDVHLLSWKTDLGAGAKLKQFYRRDTDLGINVVADIGPTFLNRYDSDPFTLYALNDSVEIAELWFAPTFIDFSVQANRRKFADADGKPLDLGANGSLPLGVQPAIYLSVREGEEASAFLENRGSGENFVHNNSYTLAETSPSD